MTAGKTLAKTLANTAHHKLGFDIALLDVNKICSYTGFLLIVSGKNRLHLQAMREAMEELLDDRDARIFGIEGTPDSGWIIIDLGSIIVHLFDAERRGHYNLFSLWGDAPAVELSFSKLPPRLKGKKKSGK